MPDEADDLVLDVLIRTGLRDPVAIGLAENLLREAPLPITYGLDQLL